MKTACLSIVFVTVGMVCGRGYATNIPVTNGLVAFYPFHTNSNDISGNGNDLTPDSSPDYSSGEYVHVNKQTFTSSSSDLNFSSSFTISFWTKSYLAGDVVTRTHATKMGASVAESSYYIDYNGTSEYFNVKLCSGDSYIVDLYAAKARTELESWTHVAVTFDGAESGYNVYAYASPEGATSLTNIGRADATADTINTASAPFSFKPTRTDLAGYVIYDRALNTTELTSLLTAGRGIDAIPEPATATLMGSGILLLFRKRKVASHSL